MKQLIAIFLLLAVTVLLAQPSDYSSLQAEAEKYYAERSYSRAHEIYQKLKGMSLSPEPSRWVAFRLADTLWRSQAVTETSDPSKFEEAQRALEILVRDVLREEDQDRIWAEVQESLGDFFWTRNDVRNWTQAWNYYERALDWWAGSADMETARRRYLNIVWRASKPQWAEPYYYYGYYGNYVPLNILDNALKVATTSNDKARAHYLIAMTLFHQIGDPMRGERIEKEFAAALSAGKSIDWYDDALYYYADWLASQGRFVQTEDGQWRSDPDFPKALGLFHRLITEYAKGETRYSDQAKEQIENITKPVVSVSVPQLFWPGAQAQFSLNWRNVKRVELALYPVDLSRDVHFSLGETTAPEWLQQIHVEAKQRTKSWFKVTQDKGDYKPGQELITIDTTLEPGAYVIEAVSGPVQARDVILVSDATLVLKSTSRKALVYFCDSNNGAPIPAARVLLWEHIWRGQKYEWKQRTAETDQNGIAAFALDSSDSNAELFAGAAQAGRQAFATGYSYGYYHEPVDWRIYAFTDRPAYRPEDEVQWKFIARQYDGARYLTPFDATLQYEIVDPRGTQVRREKIALNAFGSAWGSLKLNATMALGEYHIIFHDSKNQEIGDAVLFRLEEYKLPEFKVSIQTPEEDGKRKAFRLGEQVQVNVQADYYFGGPVSNAQVEVLVYQNPLYHWWHPERDFPWFYQDMNQQDYNAWYGPGQIIKRETLKTDAGGRATLTFDTPASSQQDFQYRIEARVTDSSRREIISSETVRVTRQRYFVYLNPDHCLYTPDDKVSVNIKSLDANQNPLPIEGTIKVTRDWWYEVWIDPAGNEISGDRPPDMKPGEQSWRLKSRGYKHEDILKLPVKTDSNGEADFHFTPSKEGYYRVLWTSPDEGGVPVQSETTIWIATGQSAELGYRTSGLEIIVDKDTFRTGQKAAVLLTAPTNDRYVLFSLEGEDLYSYQLIHVTGTAKVVELDITEDHVPNIFLNGVLIHDRQIHMASKQVIVPPVQNFLQVQIDSDRKEYQPREEGVITVSTKDHNGKPVAAEVALGLSDEAVYYIQQDYAGDPRQFYFGEKRSQRVLTQSTLQYKSYRVKEDQDRRRSMDESDLEKLEALGYMADGIAGGVMGGVAAGMRSDFAKDKASIPTARMASLSAAPAKVAREQSQEAPVQVRTDFRATVFWQPDVITGKDGTATVRVKYPDSLTSWRAVARVASQANQFGIADATTRTKKPLIVRLEAPRFFVVGDTVTISAVLNNNTGKEQDATTVLEAKGIVPAAGTSLHQRSKVPAGSEVRVDWPMVVAQPGSVELSTTVHTENYSDAMQKSYTAFEHGIEKFLATSGKMKEDSITIRQSIPVDRKPESTIMVVQITPSLAITMLDALPYLIDYPYGCTEQTMSRFLPAVIVQKTLRDLGLSEEMIESRMFGGIESQFATKTHREGKKDLGKLKDMVQAGLKRLYDFQHADGGWGWWKDGESDHWMSGYVIWGLSLASQSGISVREDVLTRGMNYLEKELVEEEDHFEIQAWMLHALSYDRKAAKFETKAFDNLWMNRDRLNAYSRSLLALSAHHFGDLERAQILMRNLENGAKIDEGTAHWGEDRSWWHWSDGAVESTAFALEALLAIDPKHKLVEPVTNWLIKNRRGAQWNNTRDTAITILAFDDYLKQSGELRSSVGFDLTVNGQRIATKQIGSEDILSAPSRYRVERKYIRNGENEIGIRRTEGSGPLYFSVETSFFSLEEPIASAGNEIFVRREYYKLVGKPTLLKGYVYERQPMKDGDSVKSGERVETVLTIEAKNDYEYLVFEDLKPAGLEAVAVRSSDSLFARELKSSATSGDIDESDYTQRRRWVYQELRDRKVALFLDKLPQGTWEIRYDLRAEVPGRFHALPVMGYAMYVPEIRANGEELRVTVADDGPAEVGGQTQRGLKPTNSNAD